MEQTYLYSYIYSVHVYTCITFVLIDDCSEPYNTNTLYSIDNDYHLFYTLIANIGQMLQRLKEVLYVSIYN